MDLTHWPIVNGNQCVFSMSSPRLLGHHRPLASPASVASLYSSRIFQISPHFSFSRRGHSPGLQDCFPLKCSLSWWLCWNPNLPAQVCTQHRDRNPHCRPETILTRPALTSSWQGNHAGSACPNLRQPSPSFPGIRGDEPKRSRICIWCALAQQGPSCILSEWSWFPKKIHLYVNIFLYINILYC